MHDVQVISFDGGRGFIKGYSQYNNQELSCIFKSIIGLVERRVEKYPDYIKDNIHIEVDGAEWFVGELAERESKAAIHNLSDDKTEQPVDILLYAAIEKLAVTNRVKIMMGVPHKLYNKRVRKSIKDKYAGKRLTITNKVTKSTKVITIEDIDIYKEAEAALLYYTKDMDRLESDIVLASVGFRTTEVVYYDKDFNYVEKYSDTIEKGNITALEYVQGRLGSLDIPVKRELFEIDTKTEYNDYKKVGYNVLKVMLYQELEAKLVNIGSEKEMKIVFAGGTSYHFEDLKYEIIPDAQMATAKGLFLFGQNIW